LNFRARYVSEQSSFKLVYHKFLHQVVELTDSACIEVFESTPSSGSPQDNNATNYCIH
jgi:hypothetical protein